MSNKVNLVIEGVVGAGKSTLMNILENKNFVSYPEPVVDNPFLSKLYHDRVRYSFPTQIFFLNKRFEHLKQMKHNGNTVTDRSIYCDMVFAQMFYDNNEMTLEEFETYKELVNHIAEYINPPTLMIYLEMSVDDAIKRIQARNRDYELVVGREYWEHLNKNYRSYFENYNHSPLLTINIDGLDFQHNQEDLEYVLKLIQDKLKNLNIDFKL